MNEKCNWDPSKHNGEPCPTHDGKSFTNSKEKGKGNKQKFKEWKENIGNYQREDQYAEGDISSSPYLDDEQKQQLLDLYRDKIKSFEKPKEVFDDDYEEEFKGYADMSRGKDDELDALRERDLKGLNNDFGWEPEDNGLDLEQAVKNADDDVLDKQFGKDTPERKLVGAIKYSDFIGKDGQVKPEMREARNAFLEKKDAEASKIITDAGMKDINLTAALKLKNDYAEGKITKDELVEKYRDAFKNSKDIVGAMKQPKPYNREEKVKEYLKEQGFDDEYINKTLENMKKNMNIGQFWDKFFKEKK